jgi:hypothetical protein
VWAVLLVLFAILLQVLAHSPVADLDMFHEMALIREALADGRLARQDVYAYTPTVSRVVHHEWGTGAVLYFVAVAAGLGGGGILVLRFLLLAGVAVCCYVCARYRRARGAPLAVLTPVAIGLMAGGVSPVRAQLFTFLFLACLLVTFEWDRKGNRRWPLLWLPVYLVWLNMHGGFVVGAGLFALYTLERFARALHGSSSASLAFAGTWHLFLAGAAMVVLPLINPYGWDYIPYLWNALFMERPYVAEWAPLWDPRVQREYVAIYAVSLLVLLYAVGRSSAALRLPGLALVLVAAVFAARSQRLLPVYGIVWISYVPAYLSATDLRRLIERWWRRHTVAIAAGALAAAALLLARSAWVGFWELSVPAVAEAPDGIHFPVGATDYLAAHGFHGNLMTHYNAGAFVSWRLHPAVRVGMDSRYEVAYLADVVDEIQRLYTGEPGWEDVLARYPTHAVLVASDSPLHPLLMHASDAWPLVYRDDGYSIFARTDVADRLPRTDRRGETIVGTFP